MTLFSFLLMGITILFLIRYQILLLNYREFGDESETIVVTKMMANGSLLYRDIFNHHGPLTFLFGYIIELFGSFGVSVHRIPIMILQWLALAAIYFSPIVNNKVNKNFNFIIVATIIVVFFPDIFGHMYMYQTLAGIFSVIIFSQFTLPSVLGYSQPKVISCIGAALAVSLPFLAITYLPAALLFLIASIRKNNFKISLIGIFIGLVFNILFLSIFGSINGFIAYHIYLNLNILSPGQGILELILNVLKFATGSFFDFFTIIYILIIASMINKKSTEPLFWRGLIVSFIIVSFCVRGAGFGFSGLPYYYSLLAVSPVLFMWDLKFKTNEGPNPFSKQLDALFRFMPVIIISIICIIKVTLILPNDLSRIKSTTAPEKTDFSVLAKSITEKDDKILALTFANYEYIAADRLPASAHFFYLPWQAKYNENPILNIYSSLYDDILNKKPKIIYADKWKVWDLYEWESYASDINELLETYYYKINDKPYYIRKDINLEDFGIDKETGINLKDFFVTDENWDNGLLRQKAGFMMPNSKYNVDKYKIGTKIKVSNNDIRKVIDVTPNGKYLMIYIDGEPLDYYITGLPTQFSVLE